MEPRQARSVSSRRNSHGKVAEIYRDIKKTKGLDRVPTSGAPWRKPITWR